MKKYQLHTKTEDILKRFPALCKRLEGAERTPPTAGAPRVLCVGADLEKAGACVAVQCGLGEPVSLGTLTRETILSLLAALRARGWRCVLGLEACGFGWRWKRQLREAGAEVLTFATEALTGRRKTNARDAAALARLVGDRIVHGNTKSNRIVREPSPEEQQRRFLSRHRAQLIALRGKIEAQGRGLMYDFGQLAFPECWWGKKRWPRLTAQLTAAGDSPMDQPPLVPGAAASEDWLREALEPQRALAQSIHAQILELDARLTALAAQTLTIPLPHGLGLLTEAIWRLIRWEPRWHGFAKWGAVIRDTHGRSVRKKKAVIACVRLLFIDLWRLFTARATLADLGFRGPLAAAQ